MLGVVFNGAFTYRDLWDMPFDLYDDLVQNLSREIASAMKEGGGATE